MFLIFWKHQTTIKNLIKNVYSKNRRFNFQLEKFVQPFPAKNSRKNVFAVQWLPSFFRQNTRPGPDGGGFGGGRPGAYGSRRVVARAPIAGVGGRTGRGNRVRDRRRPWPQRPESTAGDSVTYLRVRTTYADIVARTVLSREVRYGYGRVLFFRSCPLSPETRRRTRAHKPTRTPPLALVGGFGQNVLATTVQRGRRQNTCSHTFCALQTVKTRKEGNAFFRLIDERSSKLWFCTGTFHAISDPPLQWWPLRLTTAIPVASCTFFNRVHRSVDLNNAYTRFKK